MDKYYQEAKQYFDKLLKEVDTREFVQYLVAFNLLTELMLETIYDSLLDKTLLKDD